MLLITHNDRECDSLRHNFINLRLSQVVVIEEADSSILGILNDAVPQAERNFANDMFTVYVSTVTVDREDVDSSFEKGTFLRKSIFSFFLSLRY